MRYYVKTLSGENGPYEVEELRESLRTGKIKPDVLLRYEDSAKTVELSEIVPSPLDPYAPPNKDEPYALPNKDEPTNKGSFAQGLAIGFFCGCPGLIVAIIIALSSRSIGSATMRGVLVGFVVQAVIGIILQIAFPELMTPPGMSPEPVFSP